MKFWDASAIVPLIVSQPATSHLLSVAKKDSAILVWWGTRVECVSAVARLERSGDLAPKIVAAALTRLNKLEQNWHEIDPTEVVREAAARFLRVHALRAADALQLAAAFVAADRRPTSLEVVTLDDRLAAAARKEGFVVIGMD